MNFLGRRRALMASFGSGIGVGLGWRDSHATSVFKTLTNRNSNNNSFDNSGNTRNTPFLDRIKSLANNKSE